MQCRLRVFIVLVSAWCQASYATAPAVPVNSELLVGQSSWASFGWKVGVSHTNILRLGNKFQLSGAGDATNNDEWLRLFDVGNRGFYGGFAAGKLWGQKLISNELVIGQPKDPRTGAARGSWRLSADSANSDWLKLTTAKGDTYFGGLAAGKLKTNSINAGQVETNKIQITSRFSVETTTLQKKDFLQLIDPQTKNVHTGGMRFGSLKVTDGEVEKEFSVGTVMKLGNKWKLHFAGDPIKDDEYLRLMGSNGKTLYGGFASAKMRTEILHVDQGSTFQGKAVFSSADFKGRVSFVHSDFQTLTAKSLQVGSTILSGVGVNHGNLHWLHVYALDGKNYAGMAMKDIRVSNTATDVLTLGTKWRLSGKGDKFHNDDWLRLLNTRNTGYYGGLAVKKLWTPKAYTHVIQLGTKWRLSGVGDSVKDDDWLRLMNIHNTKLSGGLEAAKLKTTSLDVTDTRTQKLTLAKKYQLVGGSEMLRVMNAEGAQLRDFEAKRVKAHTLEVTQITKLGKIVTTQEPEAPSFRAKSFIQIASWKLAPAAGDQSTGHWLQLSYGPPKFELKGKLLLDSLKSKDLIGTGTATLKEVKAEKVFGKSASLTTLKAGKITVTEGIWVNKQRITPVSQEEVQALREELAEVKQQLARMQQ